MTSDRSPPGSEEETAAAFGPPGLRAAMTAPPGLADRISLRNHIVAAEIGAFEVERGVKQRLRFDVVVELADPGGGAGDDVDRVLSYDRITEAIAAELAAGRVNLLETLAEGIAGRLLAEPAVARVFIRIEKLDRGPGDLGVEIVRERAGAAGHHAGDPLQFHAVFLGEAALARADLGARLAGLRQEVEANAPFLLALGPPSGGFFGPGPGAEPAPVSPAAISPAAMEARRRIALLAIGQNAWALHARLPDCDVAATRTEIDWALRRGRSVIWAPERLVLDALTPPGVLPEAGRDAFSAGPLALALWGAEKLGARSLILLGGQVRAPSDAGVPSDLGVPVVWCPL